MMPTGKDISGTLYTYTYNQVQICDEKLKRLYAFERDYLMRIPVDDMFFEKRKALGLNTRGGKSLHNEEGSWFRKGGDVLGQWMQALSRFFAAEGNQTVKNKVSDMLDAYAEIAEKDACFVDGLYMYFFEKYIRGFCDAYTYCGFEKALTLAEGLMDCAMQSDIFSKDKYILGDNGPDDQIEWYTLGESVNHFIRLYKASGGNAEKVRAYEKFSDDFQYDVFWEIFEKGENVFGYTPLKGQNTAHFHAYSHVNTMNSALSYYAKTGAKGLYTCVTEFYDFMRNTQELATGGYGAHLEWLMPTTGIIQALSYHHDNSETQCDSYAVYRLSNSLLALSGHSKYGNWMEKLLYNMTQASLPIDEKGHTFYYSDYCVTGGKKGRHPNTWTCCTGTRPLIMTELLRDIYFYDEKSLYVNLYVSSRVAYKEMYVVCNTDFPYVNECTFVLSGKGACDLKLRIPEWQKGMSVQIDGREIKGEERDGWLCLHGVSAGSCITVCFMPTLRFVAKSSKGRAVAAVNYGAITLAAEKKDKNVAEYLDFKVSPETQLEKIGPLTFRLKNTDILFKAFLEYAEGEEYYMYFPYKD